MIAYVQQNWSELLAVSAVAAAATGAVVYAHRGGRLLQPAASDLFAVQASHEAPTPRLGGIALFASVLASIVFLSEFQGQRVAILLACAAPLVVAGLLEDLRRNVRPLWRLAAAAAASGLAIMFFGRWLPRLDVPFVDGLMLFAPLAWVVTIFAVTGLSHAFNIIDGMNGLCLSVAMSAGVAIATIAYAAGDRDFAEILMLCVAAMLGVFMWNYPFGKIFLGDAGAYLMGFLIAWLAATLLWRNPQVSAWSLLLACFWPVAETTLAIVRRVVGGKLIFHADSLHTHHLVLRLVEARLVGPARRRIANPLTTAMMAPYFVAPPVVGALLWNAPFVSFLAVATFAALFVATYAWLTRSLEAPAPPRRLPVRREAAVVLENANSAPADRAAA